MNVFSLDKTVNEPCAIALGYFDGVHLGHRRVIESAVEYAKQNKIKSAVFTFGDKNGNSKKFASGALYSEEHRVELLKELGADLVIMPDFSEFALLSPSDFVLVLKQKFKAAALFCGEDYRFGKGALGDADTLRELCREYKIELSVLPKVTMFSEEISASRIKKALLNGEISLANKLLGRAYSFKSQVESGEHIGSKRLYPTINQSFSQNSVKLKNGVYASKVLINGKEYNAVTNIGICPSVKNLEEAACESYIIDKTLDLYGASVEVRLIEYIREEMLFDNIDSLKAQIEKDINKAKKLL